MHHVLIAIDCWSNMPKSQVMAIANTQADLAVHHNPDQTPPHRDMPDWRDLSQQQIITHIHQHRPCVVTYVGQHWQICLQHRPLGIRWMSRFRPWVTVRVRPSLCRFVLAEPVDGGLPADRAMRYSDLGPEWRAVSYDLYEMC